MMFASEQVHNCGFKIYASSLYPMKMPENKRVFVSKLSPTTTNKDLLNYFHKFGNISNGLIFREKDGISKCAIVIFVEALSAEAVLSENKHVINEQTVKCSRIFISEIRRLLPYEKVAPENIGFKRLQRFIAEPKEYRAKLLVARLPSQTTRQQLWDYFSIYGGMKQVHLIRKYPERRTDGSLHKLYGFVVFCSSMAVEYVQITRPHIINNKKVSTRRVYPDDYIEETRKQTNFLYALNYDEHITQSNLLHYFQRYGSVKFHCEGVGEFGYAYMLFKFSDYDVVDKLCFQAIHYLQNGSSFAVQKYLKESSSSEDTDDDDKYENTVELKIFSRNHRTMRPSTFPGNEHKPICEKSVDRGLVPAHIFFKTKSTTRAMTVNAQTPDASKENENSNPTSPSKTKTESSDTPQTPVLRDLTNLEHHDPKQSCSSSPIENTLNPVLQQTKKREKSIIDDTSPKKALQLEKENTTTKVERKSDRKKCNKNEKLAPLSIFIKNNPEILGTNTTFTTSSEGKRICEKDYSAENENENSISSFDNQDQKTRVKSPPSKHSQSSLEHTSNFALQKAKGDKSDRDVSPKKVLQLPRVRMLDVFLQRFKFELDDNKEIIQQVDELIDSRISKEQEVRQSEATRQIDNTNGRMRKSTNAIAEQTSVPDEFLNQSNRGDKLTDGKTSGDRQVQQSEATHYIKGINELMKEPEQPLIPETLNKPTSTQSLQNFHDVGTNPFIDQNLTDDFYTSTLATIPLLDRTSGHDPYVSTEGLVEELELMDLKAQNCALSKNRVRSSFWDSMVKFLNR